MDIIENKNTIKCRKWRAKNKHYLARKAKARYAASRGRFAASAFKLQVLGKAVARAKDRLARAELALETYKDWLARQG